MISVAEARQQLEAVAARYKRVESGEEAGDLFAMREQLDDAKEQYEAAMEAAFPGEGL